MNTTVATNRLRADEMRDALGNVVIGREIIVLEETTSTNDSLLQRVTPGVSEGLVIIAEYQTAGRGQRGKKWESTRGNGLWLSILLKPKIDIEKSTRLSEWAAKTVASTIGDEFDLEASVKLPNDVYIAARKVAGVLVEMRAQENAPHFAILGIGVNVNHQANDFPEELRERAASLAMFLDRQLDRQSLAVALLRNLDRSYALLRDL